MSGPDLRVELALAREQEPADVLRDNAGAVLSRYARSTGSVVTLYRGAEAHLDTDGGPWSTCCKMHSCVVAHLTRKLAVASLSQPEEWCEGCREIAWERRDWTDRYAITAARTSRVWTRAMVRAGVMALARRDLSVDPALVDEVLDDHEFMRRRRGEVPARVVEAVHAQAWLRAQPETVNARSHSDRERAVTIAGSATSRPALATGTVVALPRDMSTNIDIAATFETLKATAAAQVARYPQYANHFATGWALARVKRNITTKMGLAFVKGEYVIARQRDASRPRIDSTGPEFCHAWSRRNEIETSIRAADLEWV